MRGLRRELSQLPLIVRFVVVGAGFTGTIVAVIVVINVIGSYPADNVVQAAFFGIIEAMVLGGAAGAVIGLALGVLAYLARGAARSVPHRRS